MPSGDIDWSKVRRVLVVKLRSIGDTVLATPSLIALRRFLPEAEIDILLEDWVAPVLDGFEGISVITVGKGSTERLRIARELRRRKYDVAVNMHGGTTATLLTFASGARHRIGFADYQYSFLYNHLLSSANDFWHTEYAHSAEQQLALLGFVGVPVEDRPKSSLAVTEQALASISDKIGTESLNKASYALVHPGSAFETKRWPTENYADLFEYIAASLSLAIIAVGSPSEQDVLAKLQFESAIPVTTLSDLTLPEITALASKAKVFVGNDSGIAHIAAAVSTPSVVVFGSSNRNHWRPWTDAPNAMVFKEFSCQPCPGYTCEVYGHPRCIQEIEPSAVFRALERILSASNS